METLREINKAVIFSRNYLILRMYLEDEKITYSKIAECFKLSKSRIPQIISRLRLLMINNMTPTCVHSLRTKRYLDIHSLKSNDKDNIKLSREFWLKQLESLKDSYK